MITWEVGMLALRIEGDFGLLEMRAAASGSNGRRLSSWPPWMRTFKRVPAP